MIYKCAPDVSKLPVIELYLLRIDFRYNSLRLMFNFSGRKLNVDFIFIFFFFFSTNENYSKIQKKIIIKSNVISKRTIMDFPLTHCYFLEIN